MTEAERIRLQVNLSAAFRPGAPINSADLFSGRKDQVDDVINATFQPGQHVVMFGERGVGKTSLAMSLTGLLKRANVTPLSSGTVNCDGTDDFSSLWHKVFRELQVVVKLEKPGFAQGSDETALNLENLLPEKVTPDDVRVAITQAVDMATDRKQMIIVLDEVDRIKRKQVTTLLADTLKTLSDHLVPATIILIGVADAVDQLISEHKSIERSLVQVPMPRMSNSELESIIDTGFTKASFDITQEAKSEIVMLSHGLPHFTHLLSLESGLRAVNQDKTSVAIDDVYLATENAVKKSHSILSSYIKATDSAQKSNLFKEVLYACARAKKDELGWFSSSDVAPTFSELMGKEYSAPYFARQLNEFTEDSRGQVLKKAGTAKRHKYRFDNPLLEPFIIITALSTGMIKPSDLR